MPGCHIEWVFGQLGVATNNGFSSFTQFYFNKYILFMKIETQELEITSGVACVT